MADENYPVPNWIRAPQNVAGLYLQGVNIANQIGEAQARLSQANQQAQLEFYVQQQKLKQQADIEQQQLEVTKQYHQQQHSFQQQELARQQQETDMKVKDAAQKLIQHKQFIDYMQTPGADPIKGILKFLPGSGSVEGLGPVAEAYRRETQVVAPPSVETFTDSEGVKHDFLKIQDRGGGFQYQNLKPPVDPFSQRMMFDELNETQKNRDQLVKDQKELLSLFSVASKPFAPDDTDALKAKKQEYQDRQSQIDTMTQRIEQFYNTKKGQGRPGPGASLTPPGAAAPAPGGRTVVARSKLPDAQTSPSYDQYTGVGPYGATFGPRRSPAAAPVIAPLAMAAPSPMTNAAPNVTNAPAFTQPYNPPSAIVPPTLVDQIGQRVRDNRMSNPQSYGYSDAQSYVAPDDVVLSALSKLTQFFNPGSDGPVAAPTPSGQRPSALNPNAAAPNLTTNELEALTRFWGQTDSTSRAQ